jgi:catechol 2,3-dioxygenase-like lactoylglutathione lyase family enzyme
MWLFAILLFVIQVTAPAQSNGSQAGKQTSTAVEAEKQEARKPEMKGKILGIGGIFFKSADPAQTREWYGKHLGLVDKGQGAILPWREKGDPQNERMTVWSVFPATTKYFDPSTASFMVNYIVDDIDALLERLKKEGVKIDPKRQDEAYGRFAWIYDSDGNKIELWQPPAAKK